MAERAGRQLTLAEIYRHFGETDVRESSPLYEAVSVAIADSDAALAAIETVEPLKRHPTVILAALHDVVLQGGAPALAAAYAERDASTAGALAVAALVAHIDAVRATAELRQTQTNETGRCAVLAPAIAIAAARLGATAVALIDVGCSAGLNLSVDRIGVTYSDGSSCGDVDSPLHLTCELRGGGAVPLEPLPPVVARVGVDLNPVDVKVEADARWLRACVWPDQPDRIERLDAAIALSRDAPPTLLQGNAIDVLPDALALVPDDALVIVTTTWAVAYFPLEDRLRFLRRLDEQSATRPLAWVSAEGVGIAPGVPTMGDSRLAAHSLVGLLTFEGRRMHAETLARCHPHGAWVEWLA